MTDESGTDLVVSDVALAKIAAQAASEVPGVARLAPSLTKVLKSTLVQAAKTLVNQPDEQEDTERADSRAVEIEHVNPDLATVTIRIIATGDPTVLLTVDAVQRAVQEAIDTHAPTPINVAVLVVGAEPHSDPHHKTQA